MGVVVVSKLNVCFLFTLHNIIKGPKLSKENVIVILISEHVKPTKVKVVRKTLTPYVGELALSFHHTGFWSPPRAIWLAGSPYWPYHFFFFKS